MVVRISVMVLRLCGLLALIIGVLYWLQIVQGRIVDVHMMFGILMTLSLWILGFFILRAPKGANVGLGIGAFVMGLIVIAVGVSQLMVPLAGDSIERAILRIVHVILGLGAMGMGESIARRYRQANTVAPVEVKAEQSN